MENQKKSRGNGLLILIAIISIVLMLFASSLSRIIVRDIFDGFAKNNNVEQMVNSMQNTLNEMPEAEADVYYESETDTIFVSLTMDIDFTESIKMARSGNPSFRNDWDNNVLPNMLKLNDVLIQGLKESNLEDVDLIFTWWNDINNDFKILELKNNVVTFDSTK